MEHDAYSSRRYEENWSDSVEASKVDAEEISELKEAYALLFKDNALLRQGQADYRRECDDTDAILRVLGLDPFRCRTDGGSLRLAMISGAIEHRDVMLTSTAKNGLFTSAQMHAYAAERVAAERDRCAALCESKRKVWDGSYVDRFETPGQCASAILGTSVCSEPGLT